MLYDWSASRNPRNPADDFLLEGNGELEVTPAGALLVRTFHLGPNRKATNIWLKTITLPPRFRLSFRYQSNSVAGNTMVIFHATPVLLQDLFEDSRPDARYCDLASWRKIVAYTVGFHRAPYNNPSVLRKIGGNVPLDLGMMPWPSDRWRHIDSITTLHSTQEPLAPANKNKPHDFVLERTDRIRFLVNGTLVHDLADTGQYPHHTTNLTGGHLGFRNFGGPADDLYSQIQLEAL
jgi:hypothetical protein